MSFHALSKQAILPKCPHVHQPRSSLDPILLRFYGGFITKAWLIKALAIGSWFNLQSLSLPLEVRGLGQKDPTLRFIHPWVWFPSHLINIIKDTFISCLTWEIPRVFTSLSQKSPYHKMKHESYQYFLSANNSRLWLVNCQGWSNIISCSYTS